MSDATRAVGRALATYSGVAESALAPLAGGLIHQSFSVPRDGVECVLQRVNPIFSPGIHENIRAVTEHLHEKGVSTFRLVPTRSGGGYSDLRADGVWRLMTRVPGVTFDTCSSEAQARSAGNLVGCFHSALADLEHEFRPLGIVLHDTPAHLRELEEALAAHGGHPLYERVAPVADEILALAGRWSALDGLPQRTAHGDLKFNNILFAAESGDGKSQAVSIIDLDTLAPMPLWIELGDAWRSWCNRAGEDSAEASLDLGIFRAAAGGYLSGLTFELEQEERASLAQGIERISLELAARFAADALAESYFGWDPARFASAGEHNLLRARGQLSLYHAAGSARGEQLRAFGL